MVLTTLINQNLLIMKLFSLSNRVIAFGLFCAVFFVSCEEEQNVNTSFSEDSLQTLEEIDAVLLEVSNVVDEVYTNEEVAIAMKSQDKRNRYLAECAEKTVVRSHGIKQVTIDFGDGCASKNDKIFKGKIIMTYEMDKTLKTKEVTHTYENFFVDDKQISGYSSAVKEKSNANGNRQSTFTEDIALTWDSGEVATRQGTRISEMVEGGEDRNWANNVYELSGSWTSTLKDGTVHSVTITENLRKELSCRFIVSGTKEIVKGDKSGTMDFGDGTCDAIAVFTDADGVSTEVSLEKKKKRKK